MTSFKIQVRQANQFKVLSLKPNEYSELNSFKATILSKYFNSRLSTKFRLVYSVDRQNWSNLQSQDDMETLLKSNAKYVRVMDDQPSTFIQTPNANTNNIKQTSLKFQTLKPPVEEQPKSEIRREVPPPAESKKQENQEKQEKQQIPIKIKKDRQKSKFEISSDMIMSLIDKVDKKIKEEEKQNKEKQQKILEMAQQKKILSSAQAKEQKYEKPKVIKNERKEENLKKESIMKEKQVSKASIKPKWDMVDYYGDRKQVMMREQGYPRQYMKNKEQVFFDNADSANREAVEEVYRTYPHLSRKEYDTLMWIVQAQPYLTGLEIYQKYRSIRN